MEKFTKEQLIEQARKNIDVLRSAVQRIPGASDAAVIHLKLAEITLAALTAPQPSDEGEHFQRGYDEGHSRGLTCGKLYQVDDQMRQHRAACVAAYRAEINGGEID